MMKTCKYLIVFLLLGTVVAACGPSPEAIATMTASAWTPTPEPTLTPTPLPFDLTVSLLGEDGETVFFNAAVRATEHEEVLADASGQVMLMNLPGPDVEVSVAAQGYEPLTENVTLERGMNEMTFTLTVDPLQVNPATACEEGQKIIWIEDFEDKKLQNWEGQFARPMWDFLDIPDRGIVLTADRTAGEEYYFVIPALVGNMVWKYDILREPGNGPIWMRFHQEDGRGAYISVVDGSTGYGVQKEPGPFIADRYITASDGETWENFAIAYFDGTIDVWYNGELHIGISDEEPYEDGVFSINVNKSAGNTTFDNIVICELNEPYAPPALAETEE